MNFIFNCNFLKIDNTIFSNTRNNLKKSIINDEIREIGIFQDQKYYESLQKYAEQLKQEYRNFHVVGIGGSLLGGKAIIDGLKLNNKRVNFIYHIQESFLLERIGKISGDDLVICISKSGETLETLTILEKIMSLGFKEILCITNGGKLMEIAKKHKFTVLPHEPVSGRFSYMTNVGMLPSLLAGFDLQKFLSGVKVCFDKVFEEIWEPFFEGIYVQAFNKNLNFKILMPYNMEFRVLVSWYMQLYAESLNRKEFKIMPYPSFGTIDQHSILEGYLQNPDDKLITFVIAGKEKVLYNEFSLTSKICEEVKMLKRVFEFETIDESCLGFLMTFFALEVIFIAKFIGINPFNQEMVERRKKLSLANN